MHIQKFIVTFNKKMNTWSKMRNVFLGGLCLIPRRSAFTYAVCSIGFHFYKQIYDNDQILSKFLAIACNHHRDVFSTAINKMYSDVFPVDTICDNNHSVFQLILRKLFNTFSRNVLKRFNDKRNCSTDGSASRKLRKLSGQWN